MSGRSCFGVLVFVRCLWSQLRGAVGVLSSVSRCSASALAEVSARFRRSMSVLVVLPSLCDGFFKAFYASSVSSRF